MSFVASNHYKKLFLYSSSCVYKDLYITIISLHGTIFNLGQKEGQVKCVHHLTPTTQTCIQSLGSVPGKTF